jgi:hypothetical protein
MGKFVITFEADSAGEAAEMLAKLNGVSAAAPRPAPAAAPRPAPAAAPRPAPAAAPRPAPAAAPPPERQRAPKRTPQQLADAIIGALADGAPRTANEISRAIVTSPPSVIGPLAMLVKEGHIVDNGGRYTIAYQAEGEGEYTEEETEYPLGDDD